MRTELLQSQITDALLAMTALLMPLLIIACVIGFCFALFQALTQVQEQTLPQVVKILVIGLVLFAFGGVLAGPLVAFTQQAFSFGAR